MGCPELTDEENRILCIFDDFQEEARWLLEERGKRGKLMLVALEGDRKKFIELYRDYENYVCIREA